MPQFRNAKYRWVFTGLSWVTILFGCALVMLVMYKSRSLLGLPMGRGSLEGIRMKFLVWLAFCLVSIPLAFYFSRVIIYSVFATMMVLTGNFSSEEAKKFALYGSYPSAWLDPSEYEDFTAEQAAGSAYLQGDMKEALISGLISDNAEAIAAFGESENCVVVDWREGAEEILEALMPFLPQDYLQIEEHGSTEWLVQAGGRPPRIVEYSEHTKHEEFFEVLNQVFAPDYELWQYTPNDGDGYSLYLASSEWWQSFAAEHPAVLAKYFLAVNRLAAYWRKGYFKRLFSKP